MKLFRILSILTAGALGTFMSSCENNDVEFPDYEGGTTVYFAYQYPVRTIVLGEDTYDTSSDNAHKCTIYGTMGGSYKGKNITVDIQVDNALTNNMYFEDGSSVKAMPNDYYTLSGNQLKYDGQLMGGVEVQLSNSFFADKNALKNTYVIPLVMTEVKGADRILKGTPLIDGDTPVRTNSTYWNVQPKDFTLYCVKFINPWHATYLRRGIDQITQNGVTTTKVRHAATVEKDELCKITTESLDKAVFPVTTTVSTTDGGQQNLTCKLILTFNENNECTITSGTEGFSATGSGKFVKDGEKLSWGNKDRNAVYLDYKINYGVKSIATKDTLVVQTRGVKGEWFIPEYKAN